MKVTIEFRKPSKRLIWKLKKLDRWLDRHLPPALSIVAGSLMLGGFVAVMGAMGNVEYGDPITSTTIRIMLGGFAAMAIGGTILGCLGNEEG